MAAQIRKDPLQVAAPDSDLEQQVRIETNVLRDKLVTVKEIQVSGSQGLPPA